MGFGAGAEAISGKRAELAGNRVGWRGLLSSKKTFSIALFASLGGFVYGYNQGMFSEILTMTSFIRATQHYAEETGTAQGMLTSILELGAWVGTLANGYLADSLGRRLTVVVAVVVFCAGVIVQACTKDPSYVFGGRFVTGLGVGSLSMIVPLYNAELAPPEIRGSLVAVQQLSITFGIMVSFWICYGTNYIGGTGDSQSKAAWEIPVCLQILPAIILAVGMAFFMPQSPRHLMNRGREEECLSTLARLRDASTDDMLVRIEYLEIKSLKMFEQETSRRKFPQYQDNSFKSRFMIGVKEYASLVTDKSLFKRTTVACLIMTFQQWNGINAINYYAPQIFKELDLGGNTTSLLATGVAGIFEFVFTIPAVLWVDNIGRKKILLAGAAGMAICHFICAGLIATYEGEFGSHRSAGWATVAFVWIFIINFAYSWGPCAWIVVSEVFPLSMRAKGVSIGGSSNWLNNFGVGMATSPFIATSAYGTFIFFGCLTVIGFLYVLFFVPETKGRTLEEMDEVFGSEGMAANDEALRQQIDRDIGLTALLRGEMDASAEKMTAKTVHVDDAAVSSPHTTEA